jgi:NAD-dependent DNA ligase
VFFFEIMHQGKAIDGYFRQQTVQMGGKVADKLSKSVTHLIWSDGKIKTLSKAQELQLKIVTPLWFEACVNDCELADVS